MARLTGLLHSNACQTTSSTCANFTQVSDALTEFVTPPNRSIARHGSKCNGSIQKSVTNSCGKLVLDQTNPIHYPAYEICFPSTENSVETSLLWTFAFRTPFNGVSIVVTMLDPAVKDLPTSLVKHSWTSLRSVRCNQCAIKSVTDIDQLTLLQFTVCVSGPAQTVPMPYKPWSRLKFSSIVWACNANIIKQDQSRHFMIAQTPYVLDDKTSWFQYSLPRLCNCVVLLIVICRYQPQSLLKVLNGTHLYSAVSQYALYNCESANSTHSSSSTLDCAQ